MVSDSVKAEVLIRALPYIRKFSGKTVVVKYGGAAMTNEGVRAAVAQDLILMNCVGIRTVLVHGGGPEIDSVLRKQGKEPVFVNGLRYTDDETMDVVQMVLAGKVNKDIVALVGSQGGKAIGLCGLDGGMLKARKLVKNGSDLGLVGDISVVDPSPVLAVLDAGYIPVIATVASGEGEDPNFYNVNADTAAADIAIALKAEKLVLLTDVPGLLRDIEDNNTLISELKRSEIGSLVETGVVSKGMIPKVECCARAIDGGVCRAHIIDGRAPHSLLIELFSDLGVGTMVS